MRESFRFGRLDCEADFKAAERLLAAHPGGYAPDRYSSWLYDKQAPRWRRGESGAIGVVEQTSGQLLHVTSVNTDPLGPDDLPLVEIKVSRTVMALRQGLGRLGLRQAAILGGTMLGLEPEQPFQLELDSRLDNPDLPYFAHLGMQALQVADLYNEGNLDVRYGMRTAMPPAST